MLVKRSETIFTQTTVQIPASLRDTAKELGIGLSVTLTEALTNKIAECSGIEQAPTSQPAALSLDPKRRSRQ